MSKEHAYAYEAGYRDGSIHYELEHCPACKNVADLQEALAENAKLRKENAKLVKVLHEVESDAVDAYHGLQHDCKLLTSQIDDRFLKYWHEQCENESLRELLQRLLAEYRYLRVRPRKMYLQHEARMRAIEKEMRDLGVEVDA